MLKKHCISSKTSKGKRLMLEARTKSFSVTNKLMHELHNEGHIKEVIFHGETQIDENPGLIDSSLTLCPRSPLQENETLLSEAGIAEENPSLHLPINEVYSIRSDSIPSSVCCESSQTIHIATSSASTQTTTS